MFGRKLRKNVSLCLRARIWQTKKLKRLGIGKSTLLQISEKVSSECRTDNKDWMTLELGKKLGHGMNSWRQIKEESLCYYWLTAQHILRPKTLWVFTLYSSVELYRRTPEDGRRVIRSYRYSQKAMKMTLLNKDETELQPGGWSNYEISLREWIR